MLKASVAAVAAHLAVSPMAPLRVAPTALTPATPAPAALAVPGLSPLALPAAAPLAAPAALAPALAAPAALAPAKAAPWSSPPQASFAAPAAPLVSAPAPARGLAGLEALAAPGADAPRFFDGLAPAPAAAADGPVSRAAKALAPLAAATVVTAGLDIAVVEGILHPAHRAGTPWSDFETVIGGYKILDWWFFFIPFSLAFMGAVGWAKARWRGLAAGALLFVSGWEDILYYWLRLSSLPEGLGWLDANPFVAWTRAVTGTPSVTGGGLLLSAGVGLALTLALLAKKPKGG